MLVGESLVCVMWHPGTVPMHLVVHAPYSIFQLGSVTSFLSSCYGRWFFCLCWWPLSSYMFILWYLFSRFAILMPFVMLVFEAHSFVWLRSLMRCSQLIAVQLVSMFWLVSVFACVGLGGLIQLLVGLVCWVDFLFHFSLGCWVWF